MRRSLLIAQLIHSVEIFHSAPFFLLSYSFIDLVTKYIFISSLELVEILCYAVVDVSIFK